MIRNAGKATVQGLELESELALARGTTLRANYAYLDSQYDEFIDAGQDQAGNRAFVHAADSQVQAHGVLNLSLALGGLRLGKAVYGELALWGRNVLDDDTATNFIDFGPAFDGLTVANFEDPRSFGLAGTVRF